MLSANRFTKIAFLLMSGAVVACSSVPASKSSVSSSTGLNSVDSISTEQKTRNEVAVEFSSNPALIGEPVGVRVSGLTPNAIISVRAERRGGWRRDELYRSEAQFAADHRGEVDLTTDQPLDDRWSPAGPYGLFRTMRSTEQPPPESLSKGKISISAFDQTGRRLAEKVLLQQASKEPLQETPLGPEFPGAFVLRRVGSDPLPAIIILGGSEGGDSAARASAPLWAARGFAAVGYPYYSPAWGDQPQQIPGLPGGFADIPLDKLIDVRGALSKRGDVQTDRIGLLGTSKGAEFVLAAASRIDGFAAVAAIVPSDVIWEGWGAGSTSGQTSSFSWMSEPLAFVPYVGIERAIGGVPDDQRVAMRVPHAEGRMAFPVRVEAARIRVENIDEPVFLLGGGRDQVWDSGDMAARIAARRAEAGLITETLIFATASHGIGGPPHQPTGADSALARESGWRALQAFFERHLK